MLSKLGEDKNEFKKEFYSYLQPNDDEKAALKVMDEIKASFDSFSQYASLLHVFQVKDYK